MSKTTDRAVAYYRTSTDTNVGADKDSLPRQREAVTRYAQAQGIEIVAEFYDADVRGDLAVASRDGMGALLERCQQDGIGMVLVESAHRFARDAVVQLTGYDLLLGLGVTIVPVDAPGYFLEDTPTARLVRGVLACVSEFEKRSLVARLRVARERRRAVTGWCGGRKPVDARMRTEVLRASGSQAEIARAHGISRASVGRIRRARGAE